MTAECARCGREFEPNREGHIYCSRSCRYAEGSPVLKTDHDAVERLFDPSRDPDELVREDDWYPLAGNEEAQATMRELDAGDTVADRRRWYQELRRHGEIL